MHYQLTGFIIYIGFNALYSLMLLIRFLVSDALSKFFISNYAAPRK